MGQDLPDNQCQRDYNSSGVGLCVLGRPAGVVGSHRRHPAPDAGERVPVRPLRHCVHSGLLRGHRSERGPSGYNSHRTALQGTASGSTGSGDFNFLVATGYDWKFGGLTIGPTASFQYGYIGLNAFTETGSLAPLKFPDQNFESERTAFGFKTSYDWKIGHVDVLPEFNAAWQDEYGDTEFSIVSSLASGAGNSFTVTGRRLVVTVCSSALALLSH